MHVIWREVVPLTLGPLRLALPVPGSVDWWAAALSALALVAVFRLKLGMVPVLAGAAALGILLRLSGLV